MHRETETQVSRNGGMTSSPIPPHPIPAEALARIQSLYDAGLCLQAYSAAQELGPLKRWTGPTARTLAARLASNLGGYQLGRVLHWLAYRSDPSNPGLAAYYAHARLDRRGPLAVWEFLESYGNPPEASEANGVSHFFTVRAMVAGSPA